MADAETQIHTFVSSRLDDCSILLSGLPHAHTKSLQMDQNAATRIWTKLQILIKEVAQHPPGSIFFIYVYNLYIIFFILIVHTVILQCFFIL